MESPQTSEEIWEALSSVNSGRDAGKNGLLPELLKCCDVDLLKYACDLFVEVMEEEEAPKEWLDVLLVRTCAKEGDLTKCNNWRAISLLEIMGKLLGKVFSEEALRIG